MSEAGMEGREAARAELLDTEYILKASTTRLITDRKRGISTEMETYIKGQEAKLIKHFSRVLYLAGQNPELKVETSLGLWLSVVNVSTAASEAITTAVPSLEDLIHHSDARLHALARNAQLDKEDERRLAKATANLRSYTLHWRESGEEPGMSTSQLAWVSYEAPKHSASLAPETSGASAVDKATEEARRSVSESGMDSGASDSGLGSNVSQNSLPTTTPPASPMWGVLGNSLTVQGPSGQMEWSQMHAAGTAARALRGVTPPTADANSHSTTPRNSNKSSSSTPPPSLKWGTGLKGQAAEQAAPSPAHEAQMTRSHSHESNLPNRIHRLPGQEQASARLLSTAAAPRNPAKPASLKIAVVGKEARRASGEGTPSYLVSPDEGSDGAFLSPTSPGPATAAAANLHSRTSSVSSHKVPAKPQTGSSSSSEAVPPKSPRTGPRIFHAIPHHWKRKYLNPSKQCAVCKKAIGIRGADRCKSCKIVVHTECKAQVSEGTCGLTQQHVKSLIGFLVDPPPGIDHAPMLSPDYHQGDAGTDSSSCNSSQPSTPAPPHSSNISPYPYAQSQSSRKFTFPELPEQQEVPNITIDRPTTDVDGLECSRSSDNSTITAGISSQGSVMSETTHSQETDQHQSFDEPDGFTESTRAMTRMNTLQAGTSWKEVTIRLADIHFVANSRLRPGGLFGETHKGYHHQDVAVKFLDIHHVPEEHQLEAFKSEVGMMKNTRHENVVLFMGYTLPPDRLGIVLNFCTGLSLHSLLHDKRERPDLPRTLTIGTQIAQGMSYLHGKRILHKDLRGKNIFVQAKGKVVISDFGLFSMRRLMAAQSRTFEGKEVEAHRSALRIPAHWLSYQAPEILRTIALPQLLPSDEEVPALPFSPSSDVFAYGSVWYEMVVGEFPWAGAEAHSLLWQAASGLRPPIHSLPVLKELKDLMLACWGLQPDARPSFPDLLTTLDRLPRKIRQGLSRSPSHPISLSRSAESMF